MGRITVQSLLGEPLKAEVDILDIDASEAASLTTKIGTPEAFKASGLDYNAAVTGLQTRLQRRPGGKAFIQLSGNVPINEPFVDLILEAKWATGRIVREYTMLFDPPNLRAPVLTLPSATLTPAPQRPAEPPAAAARPVTPSNQPIVARAQPSKPQPMPSDPSSITVQVGDTASKISSIHKPASVSLDQMLVALLRANPQAFIAQDINRIKAGALLTLPSQAQVEEIPASQASQMLVAQSRDFNSFRQGLASNVPSTALAAPQRTTSGKVQATVTETQSMPTSPDKLTLSKGSVVEKGSEDRIAQSKSATEAASRSSELTKNISDLSQLAAAAAASAPVVALAAPAASAPAVAASARTIPVKPAQPVSPTVANASAPSFIDSLLEDPLMPVGAAGLIALLAGLGWYRVRRQKATSQQSSLFGESRLQPESFFGVSGGEHVDTRDNPPSGSSMLYSPSQLDADDDVDPVAEAAVYMAYGRDLQAEEILKEALRDNPERITIHRKLLEIYAKQHNASAFEGVALLVKKLTHATGTDWAEVCALGLSLDAHNTLYQSTKTQSDAAVAAVAAVAPAAATDTSMVDLDLDLDFSLNEAHSVDTQVDALDFSLPPIESPAVPVTPPSPAAAEPMANNDLLQFDLGSLSLDLNDDPITELPELHMDAESSLDAKLALAEEFKANGDEEGARALIDEVIAAAAARDEANNKVATALGKSDAAGAQPG